MRDLRRGTTALAVAGLLTLTACTGSSDSDSASPDPDPGAVTPAASGPHRRGRRARPGAGGEHPGGGLGLPGRRPPRRRRAALRPRPGVGARGPHPPAAPRRSPSAPPGTPGAFRLDLARPLDGRRGHAGRRGGGVHAPRQGPRGPLPDRRGRPRTSWSSPTAAARGRCRRRRPAATSPPSASPSPTAARSGRCRSRTAPTRGTPSTTSPPTRRSTTSASPCRRRGPAIANGRLVETETEPTESGGSATVTRWQLDEPASSYLVTVAIGDYTHRSNQHGRRAHRRLLDPARAAGRVRRPQGGGQGGRLDRAAARALPVQLARPRAHRLAERDGDPDDGDAGQHRLRALGAGGPARDRAPVVRRPGLARRLERRVAQRGHDDAHAGALRGRPRRLRRVPAGRRVARAGPGSCATGTARPAPTTRGSSAGPTSTTRPR